MRKEEFIKQLELKLSYFDSSERREVISFYDELLTDSIEQGKNEDVAVAELGSIDEIVAKLNAERINIIPKKIKYETKTETKTETVTETKTEVETRTEEVRRPKKVINLSKPVSVWVIIAIIFGSLILIGPLLGVLSAIFGIFIAIVAIIFALWIVGISFILWGVVSSLYSIVLFDTSASAGIFQLGSGLFFLGIGLMITPALFKLGIKLYKELFKGLKALWRVILNKKRKVTKDEE